MVDLPGPVLVLSPHLDDAALSCSVLLTAAERPAVLVTTVFTEAGPAPWTLAARSFLRACGSRDAEHLYAQRRAEDLAALDSVGVDAVHVGEQDALFRRPPRPDAGRRPVRRLGAVVPELDHCYPTYRFDAGRGRVSRWDAALPGRIALRIEGLLDRTAARSLLAPLGVGRHVDHLLVRDAAVQVAADRKVRLVHYSDLPYALEQDPDAQFVARNVLVPARRPVDLAAKTRLVEHYRTQVDALFGPDGHRAPDECFWVSAAP